MYTIYYLLGGVTGATILYDKESTWNSVKEIIVDL